MQYTDDERLILNSDFWILLLQNEVLQEPLSYALLLSLTKETISLVVMSVVMPSTSRGD